MKAQYKVIVGSEKQRVLFIAPSCLQLRRSVHCDVAWRESRDAAETAGSKLRGFLPLIPLGQ